MVTKSRHHFRHFFANPFVWAGLAVLVGVLVVGGLELTDTTHLFHKKPPTPAQTQAVVAAGTPVAPPASSDTTTPTPPPDKTSDPSPSASSNAGGATDTHGQTNPSTPSSQWVTSSSGLITVKQPTANSKLHNGDTLAGAASVSEVHYRINDNQVGVVAQGTLSVVNGNFSGTLHFQTHGTGARVDVFSTDAQGVEYNEIQINVGY